MNSITIISYDISNNRLRRHIDKTIKNFGTRIQKSVFACQLSAARISELRTKLKSVLAQNEKHAEDTDSIIIINELSKNNFENMAGNACTSEAFVVI